MSTVTMEDKEAYCPICYFFGDVCTPSEEAYDLPCPAFQLDMGKADDMPDEEILYH